MGGRVGGLDTPALVDGDVDDDRSGQHVAQHLALDQVRRPRAGHQHSPDDQVGVSDLLADRVLRTRHRLQLSTEDVVQVAQAFEVDVEDGDLGPHADGHLGGVQPHAPPADDDHLARPGAGDAAQQLPAPAGVALQTVRADLDRQPPGHLAHGHEQRQRAVGQLDGLVGDADDAAIQEGPGQVWRRGKMQVGVQHLAGPQQLVLLGQRLFDLHDHVGRLEDRGGVRQDAGSRRGVGFVCHAAADARALLYVHLVPMAGQRPHARRDDGDSMLLVLDLLGDADPHMPILHSSGPVTLPPMRAACRGTGGRRLSRPERA